MTPQTSLVDPSLPQPPLVPPPAPEPQAPKLPRLPEDLEIENYSQARRLARRLFGPQVRLKKLVLPGGEAVVEVSLPGVLGTVGNSWKEAIQSGMAAMATPASDDENYFGWDKAALHDSGINVVVYERMKLLNTLPSQADPAVRGQMIDTLFKLDDHEVFEFKRLADACTEGSIADRDAAGKRLQAALARVAVRKH